MGFEALSEYDKRNIIGMSRVQLEAYLYDNDIPKNADDVRLALRKASLMDMCHTVEILGDSGKEPYQEGRFYESGADCSNIRLLELEKGIQVEKEHTESDILATKIALDHLTECRDYYWRLEKMERECEGD